MFAESKKIVLCTGARTPIGHISRSLATVKPETLMKLAVDALLSRSKLPKDAVDGLIVGWVGQTFSAPNIARVTLLRSGLPESAQAVTVQNNCVSSIEAISFAARAILAGEGEVYVAGGVECMSRLPYTLAGSRAAKELRSLDTVKAKWAELPQSASVAVRDSMEQGLTDPVKNINMAATAEVCAQMYGITREAQDSYACESFRRTLAGWGRGFYSSHVVPYQEDGKTVLEKDEYPFLREGLVAKPEKFGKAPVLFDNSAYSLKDFYRDYGQHADGKTYQEGAKGTVTLFNSCGRSDGAAALVVADGLTLREAGERATALVDSGAALRTLAAWRCALLTVFTGENRGKKPRSAMRRASPPRASTT